MAACRRHWCDDKIIQHTHTHTKIKYTHTGVDNAD
jgi:hypothetical protein